MRVNRVFRRLGTCALIAAAVTALATAPAEASDHRGDYLALGDSVTFAYRPGAVTPPSDYRNPANFSGFAESFAASAKLRLANASCPGETTLSLMKPGAQSNGCENSLGLPIGYRTNFPLHVDYSGTQLDYAVHYLRTHPRTELVTFTIGANDTFLCQRTTADHCTGPDFQAALDQIGRNLTTIYAALRGQGHYRGKLVLVNYYALDYRNSAAVAQVKALDATLALATKRFHGVVADGFSAFQRASRSAGGDACAAGLLIKLPDGTCDVHPTAAGHRALLTALARAFFACPGRED